jgi:HPt (histidine-containing phosphotransfer) domain-containing protein
MHATLTDLSYLERFCKGDRSRMEKYIRMYVDGTPDLFAKLRACVSAGDAEGLAVTAHSLRPQVNYMGAQTLFDLLTDIEQRARAEGAASCARSVEECMALNEKVIAELGGFHHTI